MRMLRSIAMALALSAAACSDDSIAPCAHDLAITVSGPDPHFSWDGGCTVGSVVVRESGPNGPIMWMHFDVTNSTRSGVRYGGTRQLEPPLLVSGRVYVVTVGLIIGGDAIATLGSREFTR